MTARKPGVAKDWRQKPKSGRPVPKFGLVHLTVTQRSVYDLLIEAYEADVAVEISTKTRNALTATDPMAMASRTVARGLVTHGLADYSPDCRFLLLSEMGKREANIPTRAQRHGTTMLDKVLA